MVEYDKQVFPELFARFHAWQDAGGRAGKAAFAGKNVLCVGARLGGEVRAFRALGALAVVRRRARPVRVTGAAPARSD